MDTPAPMPNPIVGVTLQQHGEVAVEFRGSTGEMHGYRYDNPELLHGLAVAFRHTAVDSQLIQTGMASFAELVRHWGGIAPDDDDDDDDDVLSYADFEQFLAEQETHDDD